MEWMMRRSLDNKQFLKLRQATEKVASVLSKRLASHLEVLRPLFIPRMLLGSYVKSAAIEEVPGSEKAFATLQERYAAVCERPFGLPRKLQPPLPPISNQLEMSPFRYTLHISSPAEKHITITSPSQWILSYGTECPLDRLRAMVAGQETRQPEAMQQALVNHLIPGVFLKYHPGHGRLLEDLRYQVETKELADLGGLPVLILKTPVETFLPPDDFILQITQLSGIAAFQEIIDPEAIEKIPDPLQRILKDLPA
jgi:hypothetical protein